VTSGIAATYLVTPDGTGDFPTIQAAINSSADGDIVELADGVFVGPGNRDIEYLGRAITVRSLSGNPEQCVIDCQGSEGEPHRGISFVSGEGPGSVLAGVTITNGYRTTDSGGALFCRGAAPTLTDCIFVRNLAQGGGAVDCGSSSLTLSRCVFRENSGVYWYWGGAILCAWGSALNLTECSFVDNFAGLGGAVAIWGASSSFAGCLFQGNSATWGGAIAFASAQSTIASCTFWGNGPSYNYVSGIFCQDLCAISVTNSIIAAGGGGAIIAPEGAITFSCCDLWANANFEGDWIGSIAGQLGINGNISADPFFSNPEDGDFHLSYGSPCLSTPGCGPMGAYGASYRIRSVVDVPGDQGRDVRVRWQRARCDATGSDTLVTAYELWRRVDVGARDRGQVDAAKLRSGRGYPPGEWDFVKIVPAHGEANYSTISPTLCDSTLAEGMCESVFFVRAATAVPSLYFDTPPDSGYSVDNLAPAPPGNLRFPQPAVLSWDEAGDADFDYFSLYGSDQAELDGTAEVILRTSSTTADVSGQAFNFYHLTATDFSGNEGPASSIESQLSAAEGAAGTPTVFCLRPCRPNPTSGGVEIAFDLPREAHARLTVIDVTGRVVVALVDRDMPAGFHSEYWDGADASGAPAASGVYFYRLEAGPFVKAMKLLLTR
jgi:hypothetical protein